jgi:hypothetical protein
MLLLMRLPGFSRFLRGDLVNAKRFAYCAALFASALWIGTATLLSVAPGGPTVAESDTVFAEVKGAVVEQPEPALEAEAQAEMTPTVVAEIAEVAPQVEPVKKLTKKVVSTTPPAPAPARPAPALRASVSGGAVDLNFGIAGSGLAQVNMNANLGWLALP